MSKWKSKWWPESLFARLTILFLFILVITQSALVSYFHFNRDRQMARQVSEQVIDAVAELESALEGLSNDDRQEFIEAYNRPYGINLLPFVSNPIHKPLDTDNRLVRGIEKQLANYHLPVNQVGVQHHPKWRLWLSVEIGGKSYWLTVPLGRWQNDSPNQFILTVVLLTLAALVAAAWITWRMSRPLRRLHDASKALAAGNTPDVLPEEGPAELRSLSREFNQMVAALAATEKERRLMLAGISHDIRTPLTRLRLSIEMMSDDYLKDGMCIDVADIERIVQQFTAFIGGEPEESMVDTDLSALLGGVVERASRSGQAITANLSTDVFAKVHPLAIERLMNNLLDNAKRYANTPVDVSLSSTNESIQIEVRDFGPGVPESELTSISEPFVRGNKARGGDGGSGLGLAIVERIVKHHHGSIHFQNHPEGGFIVKVSLPTTRA
ncbi:HAMP domain-containing protein [Leeia sp. TBRC 13508]|uniref:histidine kinase n=1 Tax=Leeia speluncae TaxID=2884804 RepID=A0ABS8D7D5_9NEIS|nr:ATP-binding protein [Leeia speluncae]MCB6184119.1 HAMP domain-containing protein [Leeia speluncae]